MGVIKRFAISSIALGTLAIAGGASAIAFESGTEAPAVRTDDQAALESDVPADVPAESSDVPAELPETGGPAAVWRWIAPQGH